MMLRFFASFALGAAGALVHLLVTHWRAELVRDRGSMGPAFALYPLALAGPAGAVFLAILVGPETVWAVPVGMWLARVVALRRFEAWKERAK